MGIPCLHAGVAFRHAWHVTIENKLYTHEKLQNKQAVVNALIRKERNYKHYKIQRSKENITLLHST
jgi:hypothetical protein